MGRFENKVVVVTGAGSVGDGWGNGRAAASRYAAEGARLVLVDRNAEALAQTAALVEDAGGHQVSVECDVATADGVAAYVGVARDRWGGIDILQANVGIGSPDPALTMSLSRWELFFRVNVTSLFLAARAVIPVMQQRGGGAIVNVSSIASLRSLGYDFAAYSASKAAANQLVRSLATEFAADNIRCNTVVVGFVDTPTVAAAYRGLDEDAKARLTERRIASVPLRRLGSAWDIAEASLFLASEQAQFITGTEVVVDGGMTNMSR